MSKPLALCGIRQEVPESEINLSNEAVGRELESDFQELNGFRGIDLRNGNRSVGISTLGSTGSESVVPKTFWYRDVVVEVENDDVTVEFRDGHRETFNEAEVWTEYETLRLGYYDKPVLGAVSHPSTGTVHIVDEDVNVVCGRCEWVEESDVEDIRTDSDELSYNSFCSQCSHKYDGILSKAADLNVQLTY